MTDIERVRKICKEKGIPISKLEQALGFSNGYLNPKKAKSIPYQRLASIAAFLNVPISDLLYGIDLKTNSETTKSPVPNEDEADKSELIRILSVLDSPAIAELLAHAHTLEALHEARGNDPKSL